jgi:branched-subunit amino acid aminotransferase/4-amino-4-deoxychorismate lyase
VLLREAQALGLQIEPATLDRRDVEAAREVFLTNARIGVWPVCSLGGEPRLAGPITLRVQAHLARLDH